MGRSPCCAKVGLNKGAWTSAEDKILTDFIHLNGEGRWRSLPKRAGLKRCGKSCRLRWLNYLRPDIKRGNISDDEEDLIVRLHKLLGNRWSLIAGRLPGRTDNEIKNYWNTTLKKKAQDNHTSSVSFPKSRKHYKKKRDNSELSPYNVVESDATQSTKTTVSSPTSSNAEETVEPVITESPMPPLKDDFATLNFEPNIDPTDLCLNEFLSSDLCGLFEPNMTSNPSPQRPIMEILEEIWNAEDINVDSDLINSSTNDHYFASISECIEDWLI